MDEWQGVSFSVRGTPMPKGSTTRMPGGGTIPAGTTESRKRMGQWRDDIRHAAMEAFGEQPPFTGGIRLYVEFALAPPASMRKRDFGWLPHTKKPDVDKLLRALNDALTGIAWRDDAQVCVSVINKVYAWDARTGCTVSVEPITEAAARRVANATKHLRTFVMGGGDDD